jgi:nucleolar GTP-binding protein
MDPQSLLDTAFRRASKRSTKKGRGEKKYIYADLQRVLTVDAIVSSMLNDLILKTGVQLNDFENALISTKVDVRRLERDRRKIRSSLKIMRSLKREYEMRIKYAQNKTESNRLRAEYYGRFSSVVRKLDFSTIESFVKELVYIPKIKDIKTIIICGYPNVGKSMLLKKLSGHRIHVAHYPFTTKDLLIGYTKLRYEDVQLIDTPGLLDRSFDKRNAVEKRAALALKHLSRNFLYVIDPSETCGYSLESQLSLMKDLKKQFSPRMFVVATKKDLDSRDTDADAHVNVFEDSDVEKLRHSILAFFFK